MASRVSRRLALTAAGSAILVAATAGCSGISLSTASSSTTAGPSATSVAPTVATPTGTPAPPDASLADLANIVIPAYCQQPATRLQNGTNPPTGPAAPADRPGSTATAGATSAESGVPTVASSAGGSAGSGASSGAGMPGAAGHGELSMTGPEAPVLADVTGDGAKEIVAQYTCNAGGTTWPAMLVVVKHGGEVIGTVKLGDIARTEHAHVTAWRPQGEGLAVDWVAYEGAGFDKRPAENLLVMAGPTVSFAPTERGRALSQTTIVDLPGRTSFVTPTGKVACTLDGAAVTCAVQQPTWKPDSDPGCGTVDAVTLSNGQARYVCTSGGPFRAATGQPPRWQRQGSDPTIRTSSGEAAGLAFGRTLTTGQVTCTAAISGVTCSDPLTGHGFTVSTDTARLF